MPKMPKEMVGTQWETGPNNRVEKPKTVQEVCEDAGENAQEPRNASESDKEE